MSRLVYAHKGNRSSEEVRCDSRRGCSRYPMAPRDRCIEMRPRDGIIAHRIQADATRGPSIIATDRRRFMRINITSERGRPTDAGVFSRLIIEATCRVRGRRAPSARPTDKPFRLAVDPVDVGRVYAHKLTGSPTSTPSTERAVQRDIGEHARSSHRYRPQRHVRRVAHRHRHASIRRTISSSHRSPSRRLCA